MLDCVTAVIPAYNEEERIKNTLSSLLNLKVISKIIVIDDGSTDNTAEISKSYGVEVISLPYNRGKGAALNESLQLINTPYAVFIDADLEASVSEITKLITPLYRNDYDMVIASFPKNNNRNGFGIVKKVSKYIVRKFGGLNLQEPLSGQRALTREALLKITPFANGFGVEVIANIMAGKSGLRVIEVSTAMRHRVTGKNIKGFLHRGKQLYHILTAVLVFNLRRTSL